VLVVHRQPTSHAPRTCIVNQARVNQARWPSVTVGALPLTLAGVAESAPMPESSLSSSTCEVLTFSPVELLSILA
jgi:hypothetical protein